MRIIAYLRVSTDKQVQNGKDGISAQKYACEQFAKNKGWCIDEFVEEAGLSGALKISRRPGLMSAIERIKKGDILIVYKLDRLARTRQVLDKIIEEVEEKKKARIISSLGEGTETKNRYDFNARMGENTAIFALSMERTLAEIRTKNKMDEKKSKNECVGHIPYGFKLCDDGLHLEVNIDEQKIIKEMAILREQGLTIRKAANVLNEKNLFNRGNRPWTYSAFFRICNRHGAVANQNE